MFMWLHVVDVKPVWWYLATVSSLMITRKQRAIVTNSVMVCGAKAAPILYDSDLKVKGMLDRY